VRRRGKPGPFELATATFHPFGTLPTGVAVVNGCDSATLTGSVVTINMPVMPSGYIHKITLDLLFA
jgi:hypothetical protein